MSININTKFGEIVTSQAINEKVATIFGGNALIKGFDVTVKDNVVSVSPGECCICGASIEETDEKTLELEDLLLLNKNIIVVLSYNHKEYDFSYRLALESSVSDNELIVATLIVENSLIKNIVDVEKVATLIELNEIERTISENISSAQHLEYQGKNLTCVETNNSKTENISIKGDSKKLGNCISSVGSYGNTLKIRSHGKNLFNKNQAPENIVGFGDNVRMFRVRENVSYTYSSNPYVGQVTFRFFDCNNLHLSQITVSSGESLISPKNSFFAKVHTDMDSDVQIEESSVVTEYESYQEHVVEIPLPMQGGLKALPSGICDEITKDGDIIQRVDRIIFNGDENWNLLRNDSFVTFYLDFEETTSDPNQEVISNKFASFGFNQNIENIYCDNKRVYITMPKDAVANNNVDGFKLWLGENNVEMLFEIDHAGDVRVENINIHTFKGVNNIITDCAVKPIISLNNEEGESLTFNSSEDSYTDDLKIKGNSIGGIKDENIILDKVELPIFNGTTNIIQDNKITGDISFKIGDESKIGSGNIKIENDSNSVTSDISIKGKTLYKQTHCKFEEGFNIKFDDKYPAQSSEITKQVEDAKNGKETLHLELVDMENRMTENIAKQYLPVSSDNGNMKVEDCYNGLTKDLKVEGRTLQNLIDNPVHNFVLNTNLAGKSQNWNMLKQNTEYTAVFIISGVKMNASGVWMRITYEDDTVQTVKDSDYEQGFYSIKFTTLNKSIKKNTPNGNYIGYLRNFIQGQAVEITAIIIEGDHTANPPQHYFDGIKSLGEEENKISILSTGKNLIPNDIVWKQGNYTSPNLNSFVYSSKFRVHKGNYVFSNDMNLKIQDYKFFNGEQEISFVTAHTKNTITIPENVTHLGIVCYFKGELTPEIIQTINVQLEEGTTATAYEKYKVDRKDILLPVTGGAKGLPSGVADEQFDNGDYLQKITRRTLNYDGTWYTSDNFNSSDCVVFKDNSRDGKPGHNVISNNFKAGSITNTSENIEYIQVGSTGEIFVKILKSKLETPNIAGFKRWLQANPTIVYYELAKPILHKAESPTDNNLATFKDITHITTTNKIQGLVSGFRPVPETYTDTFDSNFINELESVGDSEDNLITVLSGGMNLYHLESARVVSNWQSSSVKDEDSIIVTGNNETGVHFSEVFGLTLKAGRKYCLGYSIKTDVNKGYALCWNRGTTSMAFVMNSVISPLVDTDVNFACYVDPNQTARFKIWVVESDNVEPYESYKQFKKNISLPVTDGCKSLPNGVSDEILANGDYLQKIKRVTVTRNYLSNFEPGDDRNSRYIYFLKSFPDMKLESYVSCNTRSHTEDLSKLNSSSLTTSTVISFGFNGPNSLTVSEKAEAILKECDKGLEILYELKTPILHKATSESVENTKINLPPQFSHFNAIDSASKKENGIIVLTNAGSSRDEIKLLAAPADGLKSVSNNLADEIITDGSIDKNIDRIVFNGTEEWKAEDESGEFKVFFTKVNKATDAYLDVALCDRFPSLGYIKHKENIFIDNKRVYIVIHESKLASNDVAGFKAWLASNNTEVLFRYDKTESVREENLNLHTFAGITRISQDSSVSGSIVAEVPLSSGESQSISSSNIAIDDCATGITNNLKVIGNTKYKQTHCKFEEGFAVKFDDGIDGKTKDLTVKGRTLQNLATKNLVSEFVNSSTILNDVDINCNTAHVILDKTSGDSQLNIHGEFMDGTLMGHVALVLIDSANGRYMYTKTYDKPLKKIILTSISGRPNPVKGTVMLFKEDVYNGSYFEGIKSLGEEENKISILSQGKNLLNIFDSEKIGTNGILTSVSNKITFQSKSSPEKESIAVSDFKVNLIGGKTYTVSYKSDTPFGSNQGIKTQELYFARDKNFKDDNFFQVCNVNNTKTVTIAMDKGGDYYIRFDSNKGDETVTFWDLQVEEGTATAYEEYQSDKKDMLLPVTNGAKGLPSGVCDEQYSNGDYLQKVEVNIYNGTETGWVINDLAQTNTIRFYIPSPSAKTSYRDADFVSNFPKVSDTTADRDFENFQVSGGNLLLRINRSRLKTQDLNGFIEYLKSNTIVICYELKDHVLHKATTPTNHNLTAFKDITHITTTNKIQGLISGYKPIPITYTDSFSSNFINELESVGDSTENKVNILSTGKNLFNNDFLHYAYAYNEPIKDGSTSSMAICKVDENKTYSYSQPTSTNRFCGQCFDHKPTIGSVGLEGSYFESKTFTTVKGAKYVAIYYTNNIKEFKAKIQIQEGTIATPFEPCQQDKKCISIPVQNGCKSLPGGICDEILSNGDYLQKIDRLVLPHSVFWGVYQEHTNFISFFTSLENSKNKCFICDKFKFGSVYNNNSYEAIGIDTAQLKRVVINMKKTNLETPDVAGFKKWLQANPTTVCYELKTPILHKNSNNTELSKESYEVV